MGEGIGLKWEYKDIDAAAPFSLFSFFLFLVFGWPKS